MDSPVPPTGSVEAGVLAGAAVPLMLDKMALPGIVGPGVVPTVGVGGAGVGVVLVSFLEDVFAFFSDLIVGDSVGIL